MARASASACGAGREVARASTVAPGRVVAGGWHPPTGTPVGGLGSEPTAPPSGSMVGRAMGTAHTPGDDTTTPDIVQVQGPEGWSRVTVRVRRSDPDTVHPSRWATTEPDRPRAAANRFTVAEVTVVGARRQAWAVPSSAGSPAAAT